MVAMMPSLVETVFDTLLGGEGTDWLQGATGASAANDRDVLDGGRDTARDY